MTLPIPLSTAGEITPQALEKVLREMESARLLGLSAATSSMSAAIDAHARSRNNPHGVTAAQIGLGAVDNTPDAAKPVSGATQLALDGKVGLLMEDATLDCGAGYSLATIVDARTSIRAMRISHLAKVTIAPHGYQSMSSLGAWAHANADRIVVRGDAPLTRAISSVVSVTGTKGAYAVTYAVTGDLSAVQVGMVLRVSGMPQSLPTQGGQAAPQRGGFGYLLSNAATAQVTSTISLATPTKITFSGSVSTIVKPGSIFAAHGEFRTVVSLDTPTSATVNTPFTQSVVGLNYALLLEPEAGTVAVAGSAVTGTGTMFTSRVNVGEAMIFGDGSDQWGFVTAVNSDTSITLDRSLSVAVAAGTNFAVANMAQAHQGDFVITAISGSQVTVRNSSRMDIPPPLAGMSGLTATIWTSTIACTSGAMVMAATRLDMDNVALVFPAGQTGILSDGRTGGMPGSIYLGSNTSIVGGATGILAHNGTSVFAQVMSICGQSYVGLDVARGFADVDTAVFHGQGTHGLLADTGAIRASRTHFSGIGNCGARLQVGAFVYSDWASFFGCGEAAVLAENKCGVQFVGATMLYCGRVGGTSNVGVDAQNGGCGRLTGVTIAFCRGASAVTASGGGAIEINEATIYANSLYGVTAYQGGLITSDKLGVSSNGGIGVDTTPNGTIRVTNGLASRNAGGGLRANNGGVIDWISGASLNNANWDYNAPSAGGGVIKAIGYVGTPVFNQARDVVQRGFGGIFTGGGALTLAA